MENSDLILKIKDPVLNCLHTREKVVVEARLSTDVIFLNIECYSISVGDLRRLGDLFDDDNIIIIAEGDRLYELCIFPGSNSKIKVI